LKAGQAGVYATDVPASVSAPRWSGVVDVTGP